MPVNIGNDGVGRCTELRGNPDFARLVTEILPAVARDLIYAALRSPVEARVHQTSWADGVREGFEALQMAYEGKLASQVPRPAPPGKGNLKPGRDDV